VCGRVFASYGLLDVVIGGVAFVGATFQVVHFCVPWSCSE
jgi:hypothetical protein